MPIVEIVAQKTMEQNPNLGLSIVDLIVLLWLFSNPYDSKRRQLSSIRTVLKMCETLLEVFRDSRGKSYCTCNQREFIT
jgi:hypothetical protein